MGQWKAFFANIRMFAEGRYFLPSMVLLAIVARLAAALTTWIIAADGSRYLKMAKLFWELRFDDALSLNAMHPLYPFLIVVGRGLCGDFLLSAYGVSALLGGLSIIPIYYLFSQAWSARVARIGTLLYALLPEIVIIHGEVMTEATFMFFFFSSMALAWSALRGTSWERSILAGLCAAMAWLTRPEGVYLPLLFLFAWLWTFLPRARSLWKSHAAHLFLYAATALVIAFPYLLWIRGTTGTWSFTGHTFATGILDVISGNAKPAGYEMNEKAIQEFDEVRYIANYGSVGGTALYLIRTALKVTFYILFPLMLIGFFVLKRHETRWGAAIFIVIAAVGYFIPGVLTFVAGTPFGYRYILITFALFLAVAAAGACSTATWTRRETIVLPAFLILLSIAMSVKIASPKRADKLGIREAALEVRARFGNEAQIMSDDRRVEFYADGNFVELPATFSELEKAIDHYKVSAILIPERSLRNREEGFEKNVAAKYHYVGDYPSNPRKGTTVVKLYVTGQ